MVVPKPRSASSWQIPQYDRTRFALGVTEWVNHTVPSPPLVWCVSKSRVMWSESGPGFRRVRGGTVAPLRSAQSGGFRLRPLSARPRPTRGLPGRSTRAVTVLRRRTGWFGTRFDPVEIVERARERCDRTLERVLSDDTVPLGKGLLLGTRTDIDPELKRDFAESGTAHILAISGANVVILSGMLWAGACLATRSRRARLLLVMLLLAGYLLLTDWQPPVVRSVLMLELWLWSHWRERSHNGWNLLAAAGAVMLVAHPSSCSTPARCCRSSRWAR